MLKDPEQAKLLHPAPDYRAAITRLCVDMNLKLPIAEYYFFKGRKWRFDFAWPAVKVAIEIDGGILSGGRHTSRIFAINGIHEYESREACGFI